MYTFGKSTHFKKLTNVGDRGSERLSYQLATRIVNVVNYQIRCNHSIIPKNTHVLNNCKSTVETLLQEDNRKPAAFYHLIDLQNIMLLSTELVGVMTQTCRG